MAVQRNDWISPEEYLRIDHESLDVKYEYVLVSQQRQQVEIFTRNGKRWMYQLFGPGEEIELFSLDIRFPIELLYEDVPLPIEKE